MNTSASAAPEYLARRRHGWTTLPPASVPRARLAHTLPTTTTRILPGDQRPFSSHCQPPRANGMLKIAAWARVAATLQPPSESLSDAYISGGSRSSVEASGRFAQSRSTGEGGCAGGCCITRARPWQCGAMSCRPCIRCDPLPSYPPSHSLESRAHQ